jgi:hypothetical protein
MTAALRITTAAGAITFWAPQEHLKSWLASLIDLVLIYQAGKGPAPSKTEEKDSKDI